MSAPGRGVFIRQGADLVHGEADQPGVADGGLVPALMSLAGVFQCASAVFAFTHDLVGAALRAYQPRIMKAEPAMICPIDS